MSGVRITTGGDDAAIKAALQSASRIITFPDGKARHITLESRYWTVFDKLQSEKGWPPDELPALAFQGASDFFQGSDEFEDKLRWGFRYLLKLNMGYVMTSEGDCSASNDDHF